jgi:hypothetical protein
MLRIDHQFRKLPDGLPPAVLGTEALRDSRMKLSNDSLNDASQIQSGALDIFKFLAICRQLDCEQPFTPRLPRGVNGYDSICLE